MLPRAGNLVRLAARRVNAPAIRSKAPLRGGPEGPDPNAVRDLRCVLRFAVHVHRVACAGGGALHPSRCLGPRLCGFGKDAPG